MKKLIPFFISLILVGCATPLLSPTITPTTTPFPQVRPDDFQVEYYWETGSLPPPYFYLYRIRIGPEAIGEIEFQADYSDEDPPIWIEPLNISEADLDLLYEMLNDMGMFVQEWIQATDTPDGGSASKLSSFAHGQEFSIPSFVAGEQQSSDARELYEYIESLVPQETWDKLLVLHDEYVAENEE